MVQSVAYAIAVEETLNVVVDEIILAGTDNRRLIRVKVSPKLRDYVLKLSLELREMIVKERIPRGSSSRSKCSVCFYRKICDWSLSLSL